MGAWSDREGGRKEKEVCGTGGRPCESEEQLQNGSHSCSNRNTGDGEQISDVEDAQAQEVSKAHQAAEEARKEIRWWLKEVSPSANPSGKTEGTTPNKNTEAAECQVLNSQKGCKPKIQREGTKGGPVDEKEWGAAY